MTSMVIALVVITVLISGSTASNQTIADSNLKLYAQDPNAEVCPAACLLPNLGSDTPIPANRWGWKRGYRYDVKLKKCISYKYNSDRSYKSVNNRGGVIENERDCKALCSRCELKHFTNPTDSDELYTPKVVGKENQVKLFQFHECMKKRDIRAAERLVDPYHNVSDYNHFNFQWNKMFRTMYPIAIFLPSSVSDVQVGVKCGFETKVQLVPNSGAHSYAGLSHGSDDSIIVDFRNMNLIDMNVDEMSVTVGPGALVGHVNSKLWKNGGYGTPLGNCMTVGMGGHGIGGGIGYWSGLYGLALDNILELKIVDAQGNAQTVGPNTNPDLWWALRGVGPGYIGIVTSIKLKMFKGIDDKMTIARLQYPLKDFDIVMESYFKWQDWVDKNEPSVTTIIFAVSDNYNVTGQPLYPGIEVQLLHIQDPKIQNNSNCAFLTAFPLIFPTPKSTVILNPSYIAIVLMTGYTPVLIPNPLRGIAHAPVPPGLPFPGEPDGLEDPILRSSPYSSAPPVLEDPEFVYLSYPDDPVINEAIHVHAYADKLDFIAQMDKKYAIPRYFFAKSFFINKSFNARDLRDVGRTLLKIPDNTMGLMITSERGRIGAPRDGDSAYVHRNSKLNLRVHFDSLNVDDVAPGKAWLDGFWKDATKLMDSGETYQNYPDLELLDKNVYLKRYYGKNLDRLIQTKRKWDPKGYFNSKMCIPT